MCVSEIRVKRIRVNQGLGVTQFFPSPKMRVRRGPSVSWVKEQLSNLELKNDNILGWEVFSTANWPKKQLKFVP